MLRIYFSPNMVSKIVFFILTVLKGNIVWTADSPPNIHEMMTLKEISETFGTDDGSVPCYKVINTVLPGAKRRRAGDDIYLKVEINDKEINLTLKPTTGHLVTRYTPVWLAMTDEEAYNKIRYDPLENTMEDIGEFEMYQDVDNGAAIVVYADSYHGAVIEGIVTLDYAIKTLPKRLMSQTLKVEDNHFVESQLPRKRSIGPDADEVTGHYVLFKSSTLAENAKRNDLVYRHVEKRQSNSRAFRRSNPKAVYPEILLVLDHNAIRSQTITQALRFMIAYWNAADMVYSTLNDPKIYLNIAGIIISADDAATPYIAEDTSIKIKSNSTNIEDGLATYFAKELDRFPLRQYDIIIAMTPIRLCAREADPCHIILGSANINGACTSKRYLELYKRIAGVAVVNYDWNFVGVDTAVHETAHLFMVGHDGEKTTMAQCNSTKGYVMAATTQFRQQALKWSPCSKYDLQYYFSLRKSECLDNAPMWNKPVKKVLPGRWLTLDGQCRNSGFEKSCQIPDLPLCMVNGCKARESYKCELSKIIPLPGTKCGENKYCEYRTGCVDE